MNCKIAYTAHEVPLGMLYDSFDDIFPISKIHSSELIILWFWRFSQKKKICNVSKKLIKP